MSECEYGFENGCPDCRPIATDISAAWRYPDGTKDDEPCLCDTPFTCFAIEHDNAPPSVSVRTGEQDDHGERGTT